MLAHQKQIILEHNKQAILKVLNTPSYGCPDEPHGELGDPIGKDGAFWSWIRDGEYDTPPLNMTSDEAGQAITALIREGQIEVKVRKDELQLRFVTT